MTQQRDAAGFLHRPHRMNAVTQNPDIRFLGRLLGDVIRAYGGQALFDRIETIRAASVDSHRGVAAAGSAEVQLQALDLDEALAFVRGFIPA